MHFFAFAIAFVVQKVQMQMQIFAFALAFTFALFEQQMQMQRRIAIFSYLVNQAHLKNRVIRTKSNVNNFFDMCTFETIKS